MHIRGGGGKARIVFNFLHLGLMVLTSLFDGSICLLFNLIIIKTCSTERFGIMFGLSLVLLERCALLCGVKCWSDREGTLQQSWKLEGARLIIYENASHFSLSQARWTPTAVLRSTKPSRLFVLSIRTASRSGDRVRDRRRKILHHLMASISCLTFIQPVFFLTIFVFFLFSTHTRYMKYLYPYECEKKNLSTPAELQAAIDGNRREGRRSSYGQFESVSNRFFLSILNFQ